MKNRIAEYSLSYNHDEFYRELTSRNHHFVSAKTQNSLRNLRILIAGCGSTGGACIEALARVGVEQFWLADNGSYELSNLNRQHARLESLNKNKARFHAEEILQINPFAKVIFSESGIQPKNVLEFVSSCDLVFDAVDVTTNEGIKAKVLLHQNCHALKKPVLAGLDLGYLQWGCSYDYRSGNIEVLGGTVNDVLTAKHPISALFAMYPETIVPAHCIELVLDLLDGKTPFASQMGCTSDALSALIVPMVIKFVEHGIVATGWHHDMSKYRYTAAERFKWWLKGFSLRRKMHTRLRASAASVG